MEMKSLAYFPTVLVATGVAWAAAVIPAEALTLNFVNITNNNPANAAIGEAQLKVDVTDPGNNQVLFTFNNAGPAASSITDVYFEDGTLLGIAQITNGTGVDFSQGASPGNLPGGNSITPAFNASAGFTADSNPPVQPNGVNPGESLDVLFNLINGQTFDDTLAALAQTSLFGNPPGGLRIGIHVQGFADGGSESFVNVPPDLPPPGPAVPEPMTVLGTGMALGLGTLFQKQRSKQKKQGLKA
jgi:hypothetical protein